MALKNALTFLFLLVIVPLLAYLRADIGVWISFFLNTVILLGIVVYHLYFEKQYSPFLSSYIVFTFLFFLVAPLVQIGSFQEAQPTFDNKLPYDAALAIKANLFIGVFNVFFMFSYLVFKQSKRLKITKPLSEGNQYFTPVLIFTITILSFLILMVSFPFVQDEIARPSWQKSVFSVSEFLIWKKVLFMLPFAGLVLCFQYFKGPKKKWLNLIIIASVALVCLVLLLWFKNPLTEKRNALGPIYICIMFLMFMKTFKSNVRTLFFLFLIMIVAFPLSAAITHTDATFQELVQKPGLLLEYNKGGGIASAFNTLNYDAFSNIMATIQYVGLEGFSHGFQLLSGLLFFVPRALWEGKPISTGQQVGEYLMDRYNFSYSNLSNPMVSEGYINFGIIGILLMAGVLAFVIVKLFSWLNSDDYLKKIVAFYFAIHLIFLLRGDFTNGFSYYVGAFVGVYVLPKTIMFFVKQLFIHQRKWKKLKI